ncbi:MAG: DUF4880 domain-containing protein [Alphaproteobacteria bacterium]|nr:MAG: DUF4880 domain-containing protein [Alphaproteobacteria bacterium]
MSNEENIVGFPDPAQIEKQACAWVARLDARVLTLAERAEFERWKRASSAHREAFERMRAVWSGADILEQYHDISPLEGAQTAHGPSRASRLKAFAAMAAAIGLMLIAGAWFWQRHGVDGIDAGRFQTAVGEQRTIDLADGSTVILNTNSAIEVAYTRAERIIRLSRGEAHFSVAKNPARPFSVYAGEGVVKAVGTAFAVHLLGSDVEVTVSEGTVALFSQRGREVPAIPSADTAAPSNLASVASLTVNENAVFGKSIKRIAKMSARDVQRKLLWREGMIGFAGEPLAEVVAEVSRYTNIAIAIEDPALEKTPIGGFFKVGDINGLFEALEKVFEVEVEWVDATHVRLAKAA